MRIALIAPLFEPVPPPKYGGTERVIAALADELVAGGHDVTLFAAGGSETRARIEAVVPCALRESMTRRELEEVAPHLHLRMLRDVYGRSGEFDIIHAHTDLWTLPFCGWSEMPTVVTMHGRLDLDVVRQVLPLYPSVPLVSISDAQREPLRDLDLRWEATCYNGLDLTAYERAERHGGDYLAFVGRVSPEKRPDLAVEIAQRCGMPLRVAAKIDPEDVTYWETEIEPLFRRGDVEFLGEITEEEKPAFFSGAYATLFPSDWPEPFGLVMIESLAAGTPVIALRRGSVPEVLTDGTSGYVCDDVDGMVEAITRVDALDPRECRREARRFTARAMADSYLDVYRSVVGSVAAAPRAPQLVLADESAPVRVPALGREVPIGSAPLERARRLAPARIPLPEAGRS